MRSLTFAILLLLSALPSYGQPALKWKFPTGGRVYATPLVSEDRLYAGSLDSVFYALDISKGSKIWEFRANGSISSSACLNDDIVCFAASDGKLVALDAETGSLRWAFESDGEQTRDIWDYYLSTPAYSNGMVYWGCGDGHVYAVDALKGTLRWKFHTAGIVHADPVVAGGVVYTGSFDGTFYALSSATGELIWRFKTVGDASFPDGDIQKGAILDQGVLYFGSRDYNLYAVDAATGKAKWSKKETGSWIIATPLSHQGNLCFGTSDSHRFCCLRKEDGKEIWSLPLNMRVYGSAAAYGDIIWFGCFNGKLYGVDGATGEIRYTFATDGCAANYHSVYQQDGRFREGFELYGADYLASENTIHTLGSILSTPVIRDGVIYFGSSDGNIYAVNIYPENK